MRALAILLAGVLAGVQGASWLWDTLDDGQAGPYAGLVAGAFVRSAWASCSGLSGRAMTARAMRLAGWLWLIAAIGLPAPGLGQQSFSEASPGDISSVVVRSADLWTVGEIPGASSLPTVSVDSGAPFDLAIARAVRGSGLQDTRLIRITADVAGFASVPGSGILSVALYGIGELRDRPDLRDVGWHTGQALAVTAAATLAGKVAAGRARPWLSPDDPHDFRFGRGVSGDRYQSFPSFHSAAAFAAATAIAADEHTRATPARGWIIPLAYGTAVLSGVSRIYQEKHWASDVLVGALVGTLSGAGVAWVND